nr:hypothetical protein [Tanacetum cinerariifolium]
MIAYLEKSEGDEGFHQIIDFLSTSHIKYVLTESPTIYASHIEQFWQTAALSIIEDDIIAITDTIDRKVKVLITEVSIRRHFKLKDSEGLITLPTKQIFKELARIGPKKTAWEQFSSNIAIAIIFLATNKTFNFSKLIFDAMVKNLDNPYKFLMYSRFIQIFLSKHQRLLFPYTRTYPTLTLTHKLLNNMKRSKGYTRVITSLFDTMLVQHRDEEPSIHPTLVSTLSRITSSPSLSPQHTSITTSSTSQPLNLQTTPVAEEPALIPHDSPLQSTKMVYSSTLTKLILRVKKLERIVKTSKARRKARIVILNDEDEEDPSKQRRSLIEEIDMYVDTSLVPPHAADEGKSDDTQVSGQHEAQLGVFSVAKVLVDAAEQGRSDENVQTCSRQRRNVSTANILVSTADVCTASEMVSTAGLKARDKEHARFNAEQEEIDKARQEKGVAEADQAHDIDWSDPAVIRYHALQNRPRTIAKRSKRTGQQVLEELVERQSTEKEEGKKIDVSSKPTRKKTLARKRPHGNDSEESMKKQKLEDDREKKDLKAYLDIVLEDEFVMEVKSLATKADGSSKNYKIFSEMVDDFDRQDVMDLHRLVEEEKKYPLNQEMISKMLSKRLEVAQESEMAFKLLRQGHYMSDCQKLKEQNHGNKAGNKNGVGEARGKAHVLGGGDANLDLNIVKGTILLNNHYAFVVTSSKVLKVVNIKLLSVPESNNTKA